VAPDLITVGGLTVDHVIAADGTVALDQAGGNGAYSAVGALVWVDRVGLVSHAVASYPRAVIDRLRAGGVELDGVAWSEARLTAGNWFIYDDQGRRTEGLQSPPGALAAAGFATDRLSQGEVAAWQAVLAARDEPGEISYSLFREHRPLSPAQVPAAWLDTRGVHLAPSAPAVMAAMLDIFVPRGLVITADPGWQLQGHPLDSLAPILSRLGAFLPSEVELASLVPGRGAAQGLAVLADLFPGAVAVKLGARGVMVWDRAAGQPVTVPAAPAATLDPTGAGDAFCGGFLAGLVETGCPLQAARFGAISAARVVERFGADGALPADPPSARAAARALLSKAAAA
jgi:sugar/nucleoside kinase (ribokinase family)